MRAHHALTCSTRSELDTEDPATNAKLVELLHQKIPGKYTTSTHEPVRTSEAAAAVRGATLASGAKAMLLSTKSSGGPDAFVLVVISASAKMDSKKLKLAAGVKSTRFATEVEVLSITGCMPGAVPPFGSLWGLTTYMDNSLQEQGEEINFNAGLRTFSVQMPLRDYLNIEAPIIVAVTG